MNDIKNIDTLEMAENLYSLSCDLDYMDYEDTKEKDIQELEEALANLKNFAILNPSANKEYETLLLCLDRIINR